jgi:hypothetical protein
MLPSRLRRYGVGEFALSALKFSVQRVVWLIDECSEIGALLEVWRQPRIEFGEVFSEMFATKGAHDIILSHAARIEA